ncbi:DNA (cytosine-5-)-methyltransferase [Pseudoxanthomonas mexicana]|uniref:DNA (cytosine-5-)-methyltransferase n=1 Tax=Pseudoxanthomonas mexicana TaxID=128785 RepID=UPI0028AAC3C0|nr:DNA (cytosine-5-)-methyltransferase [Pseudoxanthomonas mexicana]
MIFNHVAAKLSDLDMRMIVSVPEGGNWKNIPLEVPSRRLEQIRESFVRGEGSRSTYYGRLRRDDPSYTISTYFNRPGNGCHIHYSQDRVLSAREAARLQSFPDGFHFQGSHTAVSKQIGNAVPPLLAYQIAKTLGPNGLFIDLFSGAGGMGLGFKWAGWQPILANDIESVFLSTYANNVHDSVILGSISSADVFSRIAAAVERARSHERPIWILGGPPCQGFSTAGKQRSMEDSRNHLAWDYVRLLEATRPDGFVFENVPGLLSMEGGRVFSAMCDAFAEVMPAVKAATLSADSYAIPQRRKRVILVGSRAVDFSWRPPLPVTSLSSMLSGLPTAVSVEEAIGDLPPLSPGQSGVALPYISSPRNCYQALMRGVISPQEYLDAVKGWGVRCFQ